VPLLTGRHDRIERRVARCLPTLFRPP